MAELQRVQAEKKQMADHEQWLNTPVGERAKAAAEAKAKEAAERLGNKPIVDAHNNLLAQGGVGDAKPTEAIAVRGSIRRYQDCIGSVESSNSVVFYIPAPAAEEVIKKLGGGNPLPVEVFVQDTNKLGHGILLAVDRQVDPTTGTVKCKASLQPEPDRVVLINQYVSVRLLLEMKHDVVIVPATALIHDIPDRVLVINPDRSFSVREVVVGITDGTNAEIQSGLQLGETVVGNNAGMLEETRHTTSANPGPPVSFTVIPLTNGWLSYQWQLDGTNLRYQWFDNATNITVRTNQDGTLLLINSGSNSTAKTNP
jgi:multidrug efflux pump subunit AcrA (membrane-fusion protein)